MRQRPIDELKRQKPEMQKLYNIPATLRLKYIALAVIMAAIMLFAVMIFWSGDMPVKTYMFLRGCAGVCALIFVTIVTVIVYRVNSAYIKQRRGPER